MNTSDTKIEAPVPVGAGDLFGWVRIADRLPDLGEIVWLWERDRSPWIGSRDDQDSNGWLWGHAHGTMWHNGVKWDADVWQDDEYRPTHWMPLPSPPNKQVSNAPQSVPPTL